MGPFGRYYKKGFTNHYTKLDGKDFAFTGGKLIKVSKKVKELNLGSVPITVIGENAFRDCKKLESVVIPETITELYFNSFYGCVNLKSIIIPKNVRYIASGAFENCSNLKSLTILNPNCSINQNAFIFTNWHKIYNIFYEYHKNNHKDGYIAEHTSKYFVKFLNEINKNIDNVFKYIKKDLLDINDIKFLLDEKEYIGVKEGLNYGI